MTLYIPLLIRGIFYIIKYGYYTNHITLYVPAITAHVTDSLYSNPVTTIISQISTVAIIRFNEPGQKLNHPIFDNIEFMTASPDENELKAYRSERKHATAFL